MNRGLIADIDLDALAANFRVVKDLVGGASVITVVKADAYGHGAVETALRLEAEGASYLAVAFTSEARRLRDSGIRAPLLVLFDPDPQDVFEYDLIPVLADMKAAEALSREASRRNLQVKVHVKVDTGMGRTGFRHDDDSSIMAVAGLQGIRVEGVMSHFSEADLSDLSYAHLQIGRFNSLREKLSAGGLKPSLFHLSNSAAVCTLPEARMDAVRPGIMLYGYSSLSPENGLEGVESGPMNPVSCLKPVMRVKAVIIGLRKLRPGTPVSYGRTFVTQRESLIGVMAAGYADGFNRRFSNNAEVIVRGKRVPVAGRVCMDLTMLDLTGVEGVAEGDEAVIIGSQGQETVDAAECAVRADTIPYEILTSMGAAARRRYTGRVEK